MQIKERLNLLGVQGCYSFARGCGVCWTPPLNVIKVNFNTAWGEDGKSEVACVVRNSTGQLFLVAVVVYA